MKREGKFFLATFPLEVFSFTLICRKDTVKILKFGTPQTIAITVLKIEKFDVTLH